MPRVHLPLLGSNVGVASAVSDDPLLDQFSRRIRYLRVSVTDRCNYACTYCMPEGEGEHAALASPRAELLTFEEISRLVKIFARLGVRKVRLTGGEPTIRKGIVDLVAQIANIGGIDQVVMTTNGHLLAELARPLRDAGLTGVNVSIDTLDPAKFTEVTGGGDLARVIAGVDAAIAAGLAVKTNAVALADVNGSEIRALAAFAWARGAIPRFIEHMPMSAGALYHREAELSAHAIRAALEPLVVDEDRGPDAGPARYWRTPGGDRVGIISAMTEHFCDDCNRLRLTARGDLHACLGHDDATSLRDVLRSGGTDELVVAAISHSVTGKRPGHVFALDGSGGPAKHMVNMGG